MPGSARLAAFALATLAAGLGAAAPATAAPVVRVAGDQLLRGGEPLRVYGFNHEFDGRHPNIDFLHTPRSAALRRAVRDDFAEMAAMGANTVRIFVEPHDIMASPTRTKPGGLRALRQTLEAAERAGLLVDLTGNVVFHPFRSPRWYERLGEADRWDVQARFWRAVARVGAGSPAILCYELASEPLIADSDWWYTGIVSDHYFTQLIARRTGPRDLIALARSWTAKMRDAVRAEDPANLITIGFLPDVGVPMEAGNLADMLDLVVVHGYPGASSYTPLSAFTGLGKPLLLGETIAVDEREAAWLLDVRDVTAGTLSFYDGRTPEELVPEDYTDAVYELSLKTYLGLRERLGATPPLSRRRVAVP